MSSNVTGRAVALECEIRSISACQNPDWGRKTLALMVMAMIADYSAYTGIQMRPNLPFRWNKFVNHSSEVIMAKVAVTVHVTHGFRRAMLTVLHIMRFRPEGTRRRFTWSPKSPAKPWSGQLARKPKCRCYFVIFLGMGKVNTFQYRGNHIEPLAALHSKTSREIAIIACGDTWLKSFGQGYIQIRTDKDDEDTRISDHDEEHASDTGDYWVIIFIL